MAVWIGNEKIATIAINYAISLQVHSWSPLGRAEALLMTIRNEATTRAHWLETQEWPYEVVTGCAPDHSLIPEVVLGLGQTWFWEQLVHITTLHHVPHYALRCLKNGTPELLIPTVISEGAEGQSGGECMCDEQRYRLKTCHQMSLLIVNRWT